MKPIEIFFKNILLRILLIFSQQTKNKVDGNSVYHQKLLLVRLNRIGDALVSTPLLHLLKQNLNAKIYVLADKRNSIVFENNPDVDQVIVFQKGLKGIFEILKFIKHENIDTLVDLHDDVSTTVSLIIALSKVQNKFGLEKDNKKIYSKTIPRLDSKSVHIVDRILELVKLFNLNLTHEQYRIRYYPAEESILTAQEFISKSFNKDNFIIGINISAGSEARFWGVKKFAALVKFLLNFSGENNLNIVLLCSPNDVHYANEIVKMNENNVENPDGRKIAISSHKFDEFAAIISKLNLLFTPDTSAVHLASAFQVPVFGIYVQDTTDMIWSPYKVDFECVTTTDPNLHNLSFEPVKNKFHPFFENKYWRKRTNE